MLTEIQNHITQLPIMKYFDDAKIVDQRKSNDWQMAQRRKADRRFNRFNFIGCHWLGPFYLILPAVFVMLGKIAAAIASVLW